MTPEPFYHNKKKQVDVRLRGPFAVKAHVISVSQARLDRVSERVTLAELLAL